MRRQRRVDGSDLTIPSGNQNGVAFAFQFIQLNSDGPLINLRIDNLTISVHKTGKDVANGIFLKLGFFLLIKVAQLKD